jgi:peptide-methionine (R)-S-oxide reductase
MGVSNARIFSSNEAATMKRRDFLILAGLATASPLVLGGCSRSDARDAEQAIERLNKTREEWGRLLPRDRFAVLFDHATERPFSSPLNDETRRGTYVCAACHLPLFRSETKYDSGTGWPSFFEPIRGSVGRQRDMSLGIPRTEYHCIRCKGHQGHVFNDGPRPTRQRWCNNGLALLFVPHDRELPALRQ